MLESVVYEHVRTHPEGTTKQSPALSQMSLRANAMCSCVVWLLVSFTVLSGGQRPSTEAV